VTARRSGDEIGVRADEAPDEPPVRATEGAKALVQVRDDVLFHPRLSRERGRKLRDRLRVHAATDLEPVPGAALQILGGDRVREEVARAHEMQRAAHETRSNHRVVLLYRPPESLALEALKARPEREIRRRCPLRLQCRETLDRGHDRERFPFQQELSGQRRAIQLAQRQDGRVHRRARAHAFTPCVFDSG
jgi:hypothetical protein